MLGTELGTALAMLGLDYKTARSTSTCVIADVPGLAALLSRVLLLAPVAAATANVVLPAASPLATVAS
jgi:hypothetical protein